MTLVIIALVSNFLLVVFIVSRFKKGRLKDSYEAWQKVAAEYGLQIEERKKGFWALLQKTKMEGSIRSNFYKVDIHTVGSGKHQTTYTRFQGKFKAPLGMGLGITEEVALFSSVAKTFGSQDIETGDAAFDKKYMIKGDQEYQVLSHLNPTRRASAHKIFENRKRASIKDDGVENCVRGRVYSYEELKQYLDVFVQAVEALDR